MNIAVKHPSSNQYTLIWALIGSVLLHVLLAVVLPNVKFDHVKKPDTLEVQLVSKPEPPPVVKPKPIQPQPEQVKPKAEPKPEPKPIVKPLPTPTIIKNEQPPTTAPPEVIAVTPKAESAPSPMPPAPVVIPEPPKPVAPSQVDLSAARDSYGNTLWGAIGKYKQYPKVAQMRGWQGEVIVELELDGNGKLKSKKILKGSGYDILDKQALDMVEKAAPFPAPPEALRGSNFTIKVPIPFKLEEQ